MKNPAELMPFDEGTAILEVPKETLHESVSATVENVPVKRIKTSHLQIVDEGFSYTEQKSRSRLLRLVTVFCVALSVLLGFSGGKKTTSPQTATVSQTKKPVRSIASSKKNTRRARRR